MSEARKEKQMSSSTVKAVPDGMHTLTPHLVCADAAAAIEYYKRALGATEVSRMAGPDGKLATVSFGLSVAVESGPILANRILASLSSARTSASKRFTSGAILLKPPSPEQSQPFQRAGRSRVVLKGGDKGKRDFSLQAGDRHSANDFAWLRQI